MSAPRKSASLYEIFSSIQGEALRVGERHLFVRLAGCDLSCAYCDTPASRRVPDHCTVHLPSGRVDEKNPLEAETLDALVKRVDEESGPHHAISITGGEPLMFVEFLLPLLREWRAAGFTILLETGGHRPDDLARAIDDVDSVMADIKLRSSSHETVSNEVAGRFLAIASAKELAVKVVVNAESSAAEAANTARLVRDHAPAATLYLQPASGARNLPPDGDHLLALQRAAMAEHRAVRVVPQTHRQLHVR